MWLPLSPIFSLDLSFFGSRVRIRRFGKRSVRLGGEKERILRNVAVIFYSLRNFAFQGWI